MPLPMLIALRFTLTSSDGGHEHRWEIEATWGGGPLHNGYLGTVVRTREVAIREDDGTELVRCRLDTMPVTAHFALPAENRNYLTAKESGDTKRAAARMILAAYAGCGYPLADWLVTDYELAKASKVAR
jgi:hypothetical protein